jgi:hypothetical protein
VLDNCTATRAVESQVEGSSYSSSGAPAEVFADPTRGLASPLATVLLRPGTGGSTAPDGAAGGALIVNGDVHGREANFQVHPSSAGGAVWDLADGGMGLVYSRGLTMDELRAFTSEVDAGTSALPQGMQSIGTTTTAEIAFSDCTDADGLVARITEVRGSLASRYGEMLFNAGDISTQLFDTDDSSIVIWAFPGKFDPADRNYHQATPDEWSRLLRADSNQPTIPDQPSPTVGSSPPPPLPPAGQQQPSDGAAARDAVIATVQEVYTGSTPTDTRLGLIEDGEGLKAVLDESNARNATLIETMTVEVDDVVFTDATHAAVTYRLNVGGNWQPTQLADVILDGDTWKVSRETTCANLQGAGFTCPPKP